MTDWADLPALTTVNLIGVPRPGATVLLEGEVEEVFGTRAPPDYGIEPSPLFAFQRYGAGISSMLAVSRTRHLGTRRSSHRSTERDSSRAKSIR